MTLLKYFKLWWRWSKLNLQSEMAYRFDFIIHLFGSLIFIFISPLVMTLIYTVSSGIPGWNFWEMIFFIGTSHLTWGIVSFLIYQIVDKCIRNNQNGTFDTILIRPFNPLGFLTATSIDFDEVGGFIVGAILVIVAFVKLKLSLTLIGVMGYFLLIILAILFLYAFIIFVSSLSFLFVKSFGVYSIMDSLGSFAEYPLTIFGPGLNFVFTFILPVGIAAFYPASILLGKFSVGSILPIAIPILIVFGLSLLTWNAAMKKYASAGG